MRLLKAVFRYVVYLPEETRPAGKPRRPTPPRAVPSRTRKTRFPDRAERAKLAQDLACKAKRLNGTTLKGKCYVIDGDTIVIKNIHIRLSGIDAPELDHPWGQASKWALVKICNGKEITAQVSGELSYNRVVAECFLPDGRDLSAEMVKIGLALDWPYFSGGKYRAFEPEGIRKKLWRTACRSGTQQRAN